MTEFRALHPLKVQSAIAVRSVGRTIVVSAEQFWNAHPPIEVTEFGSETELRLEQPLNAHWPMLTKLLGIDREERALQF